MASPAVTFACPERVRGAVTSRDATEPPLSCPFAPTPGIGRVTMLLPGRLDATTLGDLLGMLYRGNVTGVLELSEIAATDGATRHGRTHRIHLLSGLVAGVETELQVTPIGEILVQAGKVDRRAVEVMLYRMALGDPRQAGAILVGMGAVTQEALIQGLRTQMHARLDAVYRGLADARVAFRLSRPLPKDALRIGTLMPRDFLHGRKRKRELRPSPRAHQAGGPAGRPWWSTTSWGMPDGNVSETPPPASGSRPRASAPPPPPPVPMTPRIAALRTLGLPPDADETAVRRTFKRLAMELHPDRHEASPDQIRAQNQAKFAEASAAYHLLVA